MEAQTPPILRIMKTTSAATMLFMSKGYCCWVILTRPITMLNITVDMPMLNIIPRLRMVATAPEAIPRNRFSTEPIIALVLGEENKAKPRPKTTLHPTI